VTEFVTASDGIKLAFERMGPSSQLEGKPVLLVHGFGSSAHQNWKSTGWYGTLTGAGFAVVAMDCRGHGLSDKPHDPAFYGHDRMAQDAVQVMDAAGIAAAPVVGYSMGGFIALRLAAAHPARIAKLAVCGVGEFYLRGPRIADPEARSSLAEALPWPPACRPCRKACRRRLWRSCSSRCWWCAANWMISQAHPVPWRRLFPSARR
jgi:pimeloyl-ACP methyl ester carboxylesterase